MAADGGRWMGMISDAGGVALDELVSASVRSPPTKIPSPIIEIPSPITKVPSPTTPDDASLSDSNSGEDRISKRDWFSKWGAAFGSTGGGASEF